MRRMTQFERAINDDNLHMKWFLFFFNLWGASELNQRGGELYVSSDHGGSGAYCTELGSLNLLSVGKTMSNFCKIDY